MAGGCGVLLTEKCQLALLLLSQLLPPLLNTQSDLVALAGTVTVYSQRLEAELKVIGASGETTGFQLFQPRWMLTALALASGPPVGENCTVTGVPVTGGTSETQTRPLQPLGLVPLLPPCDVPTQTCWIGDL